VSIPKVTGAPFENRLLALLPSAEYQRLLPHMGLVRLATGRILYNLGDPVHYSYFPMSGMISLLSITSDGRTVEVGMIGNEGMAGIPAILRTNTAPYRLMVQLPVNAMRIRGDVLKAEFNRGGALQDLLLRYTHMLLLQVSQSAACNRFHTVEERLCRWLMVSYDRVQTDTLSLTQEFLSQMLGAPRTSVTVVARALQSEGLIRYRRGKVTILDRARLEAGACECHKAVRAEIRQFLAA
jgi:CRP-like cAMP-binding protein